jgi:hypothetical protein
LKRVLVDPRTGPDVLEEQKILSPLPKIETRFLGVPVRNLVTVIPVDTYESAIRKKLPSASILQDAALSFCTTDTVTSPAVFPVLKFMKGLMTAYTCEITSLHLLLRLHVR